MRIVFMGTPDFAVPTLKSLIDAGHDVCAAFTQPDKPKGRGYTLTPPPVKELAAQNSIEVYQPTTLRTEEAADTIRNLHPDVIVVVAYGKILPKSILDIPRFGCVNVHGSLLPKYRGAAPIQWSVINGDKYAGVTTMYMAEGMDTGDMIFFRKTEIGEDETSGELYDRLSIMGAELLVQTLDAIQNGTAKRTPQSDEQSCNAPMLSKELSVIHWEYSALKIHHLVCGLSPWPIANTKYHGKVLKIHKTKVMPSENGVPGQVLQKNGSFLVICGDGSALDLLEVQYEGGKRMSGRDFLRGHPAEENMILQ